MNQIHALLEEENFNEAKRHIEELSEPQRSVMLGWWLIHQHRTEELDVLLEVQKKLYPHCTELFVLSGLLKDMLGFEVEAFIEFKHSLSVAWSSIAFFNVLHTLVSSAQYQDAHDLLEDSDEALSAEELSIWEWEQLKLAKAQIARHLGNPREAIQLLLSLEIPDANSYLLLGHIYRDEHLLTESLLAYQQGLEHAPHHPVLQQSVESVLTILHTQGTASPNSSGQKSLEMRRYLEETLATLMTRDTEDPETIHLKNALLNQQTPQPPVGYVEELFDDYADRFDVHLLEKLNYQVPQIVSSVVNRHLGTGQSMSILDLGCGTGLVATQLELSTVDLLVGVDVSQKMLDKANERGLYHRLHKQDIVEYLEGCDVFDVILIADTLVYLGELHNVFGNIRGKLSDKGKLIFTVEHYQDNTDTGYHLQHTGRYAHRQDYVEALLQLGGFDNFHIANVQLRQGAGSWVDGLLIVVSV